MRADKWAARGRTALPFDLRPLDLLTFRHPSFMDSKKIQFIILGILATFVALYLGISAATAQFETIVWVIGSTVVITCIALGRKIWLLIPFMSALGIGFRIPGQPDSGLMGQILVIGFCVPLFLMRKLPLRLAWTELEFWVLVVTLFVAQVYLRNPVGVNIFGGESVGGKPYAIFAITMVSGLLLSGLKVHASDLKWVLRLSILGGLTNLVVSILGMLVPVVGFYTGGSYLRTDQPNYEEYGKKVDTEAATRIGFLGAFGNNLALWISAYISPLRACQRPFWASLILLALAATMMSGYRNNVAAVGMTFLVGIAYRSGFSGLVATIWSIIVALCLLTAINTLSPLPPNVQRSLSFLPGNWNQRYSLEAESSNEWRFDIWREVLLTDRWIENKWFGDGLGFKASELASQTAMRRGVRKGISGFDAHRESILTNGDYHSGPIQTIRTIGYIGLMCLLLAQIRVAIHAHRQIMRCRNSEWFPLALFIGIPLIWSPIFFVFIVGTFKGATSSLLIGCGMIRLLQNNLPLPAYEVKRRTLYTLPLNPSLAKSGANIN
ncbi:MAG: hypothetical protein WCO57_03405 [Verrucomicrobiota bacterium]